MDIKNKSIEECTLTTVTWDKDLKKVFNEWSKYGEYEEPVLIDRCQYWHKARGHKDDKYYIMLRYIHKHMAWELSLWEKNEDENEEDEYRCLFWVWCNGFQINKTTQDMWMTSQHLRLDKPDDRNVVWTLGRAWDWWDYKCREAGMLFKTSKPMQHKLHYFEED